MAKKATNPQNLIPIKKGQILNPNGRPKGSLNMSTMIKKMLDEYVDVIDKSGKVVKKSYKSIIIKKLLGKATSGDLRAVEILLERTEGKAMQQIEHSSNPEAPLAININVKE